MYNPKFLQFAIQTFEPEHPAENNAQLCLERKTIPTCFFSVSYSQCLVKERKSKCFKAIGIKHDPRRTQVIERRRSLTSGVNKPYATAIVNQWCGPVVLFLLDVGVVFPADRATFFRIGNRESL